MTHAEAMQRLENRPAVRKLSDADQAVADFRFETTHKANSERAVEWWASWWDKEFVRQDKTIDRYQ